MRIVQWSRIKSRQDKIKLCISCNFVFVFVFVTIVKQKNSRKSNFAFFTAFYLYLLQFICLLVFVFVTICVEAYCLYEHLCLLFLFLFIFVTIVNQQKMKLCISRCFVSEEEIALLKEALSGKVLGQPPGTKFWRKYFTKKFDASWEPIKYRWTLFFLMMAFSKYQLERIRHYIQYPK